MVAPLAQARQRHHAVHVAADLLGLVVQVDRVAALEQYARAFRARGTRADHQDRIVRALFRKALRVPAAPVFLAGGRVLGTDHRRSADLPARDADVASDTDAHVVDPAFLDLLRQEGIRDRRPGRPDDVGNALGHDLGHLFRIREAPHAEHRLFRDLLDELGPGDLVPLLIEARRPRVLSPLGDVADIDVPQVDQGVGHLDEFHPVDLDFELTRPVQRVDREARGDRAVVSDRPPHLLQRLQPEAGAVFQRPAVLIGALVVVVREKLQRQVRVSAVHVDDVEAGIARAQGRIHVILLDHRDLGQVHFPAIGERLELRRVLARTARSRARLHAGCVRAAVPHLDPRERTVLVDVLGHRTQIAHIALVPDPRRKPVRVVRFRVNRAVLGVDAGPTALGLQRAVGGLEAGLVGSGADAVRNLVEAIAERLRADLDRLEQNVVFRIACHIESPSSIVENRNFFSALRRLSRRADPSNNAHD